VFEGNNTIIRSNNCIIALDIRVKFYYTLILAVINGRIIARIKLH